jgi:hypothetical protein
VIASDGRTCPHEECMTACPVCADVWAGMPETCEHSDCGEHPRRELVKCIDYDDHGRTLLLCAEHAKAFRRAIEDGGRGDYLRDLAKDEAVRS